LRKKANTRAKLAACDRCAGNGKGDAAILACRKARCDRSRVRIRHVGKTLVQYKHLKARLNRGPLLLAGKAGLKKMLRANKAILLECH
jgi:hypothetical protein